MNVIINQPMLKTVLTAGSFLLVLVLCKYCANCALFSPTSVSAQRFPEQSTIGRSEEKISRRQLHCDQRNIRVHQKAKSRMFVWLHRLHLLTCLLLHLASYSESKGNKAPPELPGYIQLHNHQVCDLESSFSDAKPAVDEDSWFRKCDESLRASPLFEMTVGECASWCNSQAGCLSFIYNPKGPQSSCPKCWPLKIICSPSKLQVIHGRYYYVKTNITSAWSNLEPDAANRELMKMPMKPMEIQPSTLSTYNWQPDTGNRFFEHHFIQAKRVEPQPWKGVWSERRHQLMGLDSRITSFTECLRKCLTDPSCMGVYTWFQTDANKDCWFFEYIGAEFKYDHGPLATTTTDFYFVKPSKRFFSSTELYPDVIRKRERREPEAPDPEKIDESASGSCPAGACEPTISKPRILYGYRHERPCTDYIFQRECERKAKRCVWRTFTTSDGQQKQQCKAISKQSEATSTTTEADDEETNGDARL